MPQVRPYRSHKYPACLRCRSRKIKCETDVAGESCRFCRDRQEPCRYETKNIDAPQSSPLEGFSDLGSEAGPSKRQRTTNSFLMNRVASCGTPVLPTTSQLVTSSPAESALILNPQMAEDVVLLEEALPCPASAGRVILKPYKTTSNNPNNPVVYLTIPRKRKGYGSTNDPGRPQRDIIQQILRPWSAEVRSLYLEYIHPCFPVVDVHGLERSLSGASGLVSSTLLCDMYAITLPFWQKSAILRNQNPPDTHFIWNQAVAALQDDFMAPTISTLHAAMLDLMGRPVIQVNGNIVNTGRVVTLAYSLGLNRNPSSWTVRSEEKTMRASLWWGVVLHDHFSSICHGIPPNVNLQYSDVPVPSIDELTSSAGLSRKRWDVQTFICLCELTSILGDILPFVYMLKLDITEAERASKRIECNLDTWLHRLPDQLRWSVGDASIAVNGAANMWLAFLSLKLLLARLRLKITMERPSPLKPEARQYRMVIMRENAVEVIDFVTSLEDVHLQLFWMPYHSYLLVTAATILLRCTIESADLETKHSCAMKLAAFRDRLRMAAESGWDLAEACLERCSDPIQRVVEIFNSIENQADGPAPTPGMTTDSAVVDSNAVHETNLETHELAPELHLPVDSLDQLWDMSWDPTDDAWLL